MEVLAQHVQRLPITWRGARQLGNKRGEVSEKPLAFDVASLLGRSEWIVDQAVLGHPKRLGDHHFDGSLAHSGVVREQIDDDKEDQLPLGAEDQVKAPAGGVKPLEHPTEALNRILG